MPSCSQSAPTPAATASRACSRGELGAAEDVDEVDRPVDLGERAHAGDAEHLVAAGRAHGDHAVALREQIAHDAVARPVGLRRRADHRDRPRVAQDLGRACARPTAILARGAGRPLRRRLHARAAGTRARAGGIPRLGERHGLDARPGALRRRARRPRSPRSSGIRSSSTTTSSGSPSPSGSCAAWAATRRARYECAVELVAAGSRTTSSRSTRTRCPCSRSCAARVASSV